MMMKGSIASFLLVSTIAILTGSVQASPMYNRDYNNFQNSDWGTSGYTDPVEAPPHQRPEPQHADWGNGDYQGATSNTAQSIEDFIFGGRDPTFYSHGSQVRDQYNPLSHQPGGRFYRGPAPPRQIQQGGIGPGHGQFVPQHAPRYQGVVEATPSFHQGGNQMTVYNSHADAPNYSSDDSDIESQSSRGPSESSGASSRASSRQTNQPKQKKKSMFSRMFPSKGKASSSRE